MSPNCWIIGKRHESPLGFSTVHETNALTADYRTRHIEFSPFIMIRVNDDHKNWTALAASLSVNETITDSRNDACRQLILLRSPRFYG